MPRKPSVTHPEIHQHRCFRKNDDSRASSCACFIENETVFEQEIHEILT